MPERDASVVLAHADKTASAGSRASSRTPRADLAARGGVRQRFRPASSTQEQALLAAVRRPLAAACIGVPVPRPAWKDRPSWFLVAKEGRMIPAETQRFMAERMKARVRTAPVDRMPMFTAPPGVVEIVLEAVRQAGPGR